MILHRAEQQLIDTQRPPPPSPLKLEIGDPQNSQQSPDRIVYAEQIVGDNPPNQQIFNIQQLETPESGSANTSSGQMYQWTRLDLERKT